MEMVSLPRQGRGDVVFVRVSTRRSDTGLSPQVLRNMLRFPPERGKGLDALFHIVVRRKRINLDASAVVERVEEGQLPVIVLEERRQFFLTFR
ncbi:hypothetical protein [Bradyrhizobium ivorense]|uniref:hypothetical protein n=1 Tax=Bradyrhizobium ivorense TaxID=2511166 RepID=UPI00112247EB|nr:hypothetical protein [Bradyrhizobium ivorense]